MTKTLLGLILACSLFLLFKKCNSLKLEATKSFAGFPKITSTYKEILSSKASENLTPDLTFFTTGSNPIASYKIKRDNSRIFMFKIDCDTIKSLAHIINFSRSKPNIIVGRTYDNTLICDELNILRRTGTARDVKNVSVHLNGNLISKNINGKNINTYLLDLNSVVIKDSFTTEFEILIEKSTAFSRHGYIQITLLLKGNSLYLLWKTEPTLPSSNKINEFSNLIKQ